MAVYLIRAGDTDRVKIGYATNVTRRIAALQAGHWDRLTLLRVWPGDISVEVWLHRHFASRNIDREWFVFDASMLTIEPPNLTTPMMPMAPLRARRGLLAKVAKGLGISRAAVSLWAKVPGELVVEVEKITGIPREKLRADLFRTETA